MTAIIKTGGKQYSVSTGDIITIEKLFLEAGQSVEFNEVLATYEGGSMNVGAPFLDGVKVIGKVLKNGRGRKITVFKYKPKKGYHRTKGHRQAFTEVKIESIG
ncbi:MAG: 50S ribosomal protein L21 [Clostridiales bacterium]|jgi:large subunit ribosomal protein L21|nr:50S ribosomal protein L21 [Clostridiales bacterium]